MISLLLPMLIDNSIGPRVKHSKIRGPARVSRICFCDNENYVFSKLYAYPPLYVQLVSGKATYYPVIDIKCNFDYVCTT